MCIFTVCIYVDLALSIFNVLGLCNFSCQDQTFSVDDAFFAWTFERRRPLWQTVLSFFVPIITLACCLFPVFPHPCKLVVLYTCLTFLSTILSILFCKLILFLLQFILYIRTRCRNITWINIKGKLIEPKIAVWSFLETKFFPIMKLA